MNTQEILKQYSDNLVTEIKEAIPKVTGKTAESVAAHVYKDGFYIDANASLVTLIDGRRPTGEGAAEGDPKLYDIILEWIGNKGIVPDGDMSEETLAFLITRSIHRHGTRLYQMGGGNNLFKEVINDSKIDLLVAMLAENKTIEVSSDIIKQFKA